MRRSYEVRLYPTRAEARALGKTLGLHRQLYNAAIEERREAWRMNAINVYYQAQAAQIKEVRQLGPAYALLNHSAAARTLKRVDRAFEAFYRRCRQGEQPGYPRFKGRVRFQSVDYTYGDGTRLVYQEHGNPKLYVQHVGALKLRGWRALPEEAVVKEVTLRESAGRWYAFLKWEGPDLLEQPRHAGPAVGADVGLTSLVALTDPRLVDQSLIKEKDDGAIVVNKRFYGRAQKELAGAQQRVSRRKRGSQRRRKAGQLVARKHEHVRRQRLDAMHKLARRLVETYSIIVVEDLDIRQMTLRLTPEEREQGKMKYSKSIYDAGWGLFLGLLESKAAEAGSLVIRVDPGHTTQVCSGCGTLPAVKKSLRHRVHECDCGLRLDRDINAARNILRRGLLWLQRELELGGPEGASGQQFSEPRKSDLRAAVKIALSQA